MNRTENIVPVLLGGDLNAYSTALSFKIAYGAKSLVLARKSLSIVSTSSFISVKEVAGLDDCNIATNELVSLAKEKADGRLFLVPCADWYMEAVQYTKDTLDRHYGFFIPPFELWRALDDKYSFYKLLSRSGIAYPEFEVYERGRKITIEPPLVVKPSNSTEYWKHPFPNMEKVYFANSAEDAVKICERILSSGYEGRILVQRRLALKSKSSVLTCVSDYRGRVVRAVLADVLLEENSPTARGNYSALITRPLDRVSRSIIGLLNSLGYKSVANFDIMYEDEKPYVIEANPRQGRSCDYLRAAGVSLSELLVSGWLRKTAEPQLEYPEVLWHSAPRFALSKYSKNEALYEKAMRLIKEKKRVSPFSTKEDSGLLRRAYSFVHGLRQGRSYKKYGVKRNATV